MNRSYVIDRLKSKKVTIDEFNFDKLSAPPLIMFLSPQDVWRLNSIAKSIKYSGKLPEKLQMIDEICRNRGLVKFASGTNRVIYRHPEFNQFVFKIAYDNVALMDNINEFRNQQILKPFVAKTFEVSPCGTVAIAERVEPIRSREEFISIADDVFTLLNEFILGKYIMSDIGATKFLNYGLRKTNNFGPVLLDYSFLYEIDENKIYCNKPDFNSPSGLCEGEIDYDDGFDFLYCTKCGARYNAIELEKKIKDNEIIVAKGKGERKMKIRIKGGNLKEDKIITTGSINNDNFMNTIDSIISSPRKEETTGKKIKVNIANGTNNAVEQVKADTKAPDTIVVDDDEIAVNGVTVSSSKVDKVTEKPVAPVVEEASGTDDAINPISFDESLIHERETKVGKNPVELIDDAVDEIIKNLHEIKIDAVRTDAINRMIDKIINSIPATGDAFKDVMEIAISIFNNADDDNYVDVIHSTKFTEFIQRVFDPSITIKDVERDGSDMIIRQDIDFNYAYDKTDVAFSTSVPDTRIEDVFIDNNEEAAIPTKNENDNVEDVIDDYNGIEFVNGVIINTKSIFPVSDSQEIIVAIDENGDYITTKDRNIIGINVINDCEVDTVSLVAKEWVKSVSKMLEPEDEVTEISESTLGVSQLTEE